MGELLDFGACLFNLSAMMNLDVDIPATSPLMPPSESAFSFNEFQITLVIVILLLAVVLYLFLYHNFKNHLRKHSTRSKSSATEGSGLNANLSERLLNIHPSPTCICTQTGTIKYTNQAFNQVFGQETNNLSGLNLLNLLPPYIAEILNFDFEHIRKGRTMGQTAQSFISANAKEKYQIQWLLFNDNPQTETPDVLITLNKTQETEYIDNGIEEPKKLVRYVLDNSPIAIFIEDYNGVILEVNQAACNLQHFNREELIGKSIADFHPISNHNEIVDRQKKMAHFDTFSFKSVSYTKTGKAIPVEIFVNRTNYFGTPALFFLVQDLTDFIETRRQLEEYKIKAEESDRLKSSFLANLSHEVRTPMNSILGFAELLAEPSIETDERKEFIKLIRQSSKELLTQINNMIDFSKIEAGLISLKVEICQIDKLFANIREYATSLPEMKPDVRLFFEVPHEVQKNSIATDFTRLQQILQIFLHNSLKYTQKGVVEVGVRFKAPQLFEFYVRDTGVGIPESKHRMIFEKFRQVDDSNSREFNGMGLGLSVASRLIQFLGGHQWVSSEPGKGSEFRCILPDLLQPQDSPYLQVSCGPSTVINKIMIVSPIEEIYNDLTQNTKPINYQIFWAQNAQEMKGMLLSNKFVYILIAVDQLPFWQELLPQIKKLESQSQLIGISEKMEMRRRERLMAMGLSEAIPNPHSVSTLLNLIDKRDESPINLLTSRFNQN